MPFSGHAGEDHIMKLGAKSKYLWQGRLFIGLAILIVVIYGCKREQGVKKAASGSATAATSADSAIDPLPAISHVLEHLQRTINQPSNQVEAFTNQTRELNPGEKRELLIRLAKVWEHARIERRSPNDRRQEFKKQIRSGISIYISEMPDRIVLAQLLNYENPARTEVRIMNDPRFSNYRYIIDSPLIAQWINTMGGQEAKQ
jgi:hypothetical protein